MSQTAANKQQLQDAFELFSQVSEELTSSYTSLQQQVVTLNGELSAARSERVELLAEIRRLQQESSRGQRLSSMGEMTARLAHQVRTPLSTALLYASQLKQTPLPREQHDCFVDRLLVGLRHLDHMVNDMLVFARGGQGGDDLVTVNALLIQVKASLLPRLAHQVRTPLSTALLYASQLKQTPLPREQHDCFVDRLLVGLRHLDHMVNDMLVFARGGQGGDDLVTVNALLMQVKASLLPRLESVKAEWNVACDDLAIAVKGHSEVLASVLSNLASNALDASSDSPRLDWQVAVESNSVRIVLEDNGPGIDASLQDRIFEPFFTTRTNGTGLGLAVVRAVIVAHQGEIELDADYQGGARFVIRLPVCRAQQHLPSEMLQNQQKAIAASSRYV